MVALLLAYAPVPPRAAAGEPPRESTLAAIAADVEGNRGKVMTMTLQLKQFNDESWIIQFYDSNNHDIVFDISAKEDRKRLARDLKCAHPGLHYRVVFKVSGKSALGVLEGTLEGFRPLFLEKIPWPE